MSHLSSEEVRGDKRVILPQFIKLRAEEGNFEAPLAEGSPKGRIHPSSALWVSVPRLESVRAQTCWAWRGSGDAGDRQASREGG